MRNRQLFWGSPINVKSRCENGLEKMGIGLCLCNKKRNYFFSKKVGKVVLDITFRKSARKKAFKSKKKKITRGG